MPLPDSIVVLGSRHGNDFLVLIYYDGSGKVAGIYLAIMLYILCMVLCGYHDTLSLESKLNNCAVLKKDAEKLMQSLIKFSLYTALSHPHAPY